MAVVRSSARIYTMPLQLAFLIRAAKPNPRVRIRHCLVCQRRQFPIRSHPSPATRQLLLHGRLLRIIVPSCVNGHDVTCSGGRACADGWRPFASQRGTRRSLCSAERTPLRCTVAVEGRWTLSSVHTDEVECPVARMQSLVAISRRFHISRERLVLHKLRNPFSMSTAARKRSVRKTNPESKMICAVECGYFACANVRTRLQSRLALFSSESGRGVGEAPSGSRRGHHPSGRGRRCHPSGAE